MTTSNPSTQYDATIIEQMAARLLARAQTLLGLYTFFGVILGIIPLASTAILEMSTGLGVLALLLLTALGYSVGNERGFSLRLQAHLLLCYASIERNTAQMAQVLTTAAKVN